MFTTLCEIKYKQLAAARPCESNRLSHSRLQSCSDAQQKCENKSLLNSPGFHRCVTHIFGLWYHISHATTVRSYSLAVCIELVQHGTDRLSGKTHRILNTVKYFFSYSSFALLYFNYFPFCCFDNGNTVKLNCGRKEH